MVREYSSTKFDTRGSPNNTCPDELNAAYMVCAVKMIRSDHITCGELTSAQSACLPVWLRVWLSMCLY